MTTHSESRERVLDAAEKLFADKGYSAVKLKDIAAQLGIAHASLYHHVPGGKQQLYIEVMERNLHRHREGLFHAANGQVGVRGKLYTMAAWLLSQPPMDFIRMIKSDMPELDVAEAQRLSELALHSMIEPLAVILHEAQANGEIVHNDLGLVAGGLFGMIQSMHTVPETGLPKSRLQMVNELIDVVLYGLVKR